MAIKRYIPTKDTFIVGGTVGELLNNGADEILELGKCSRVGTSGSSRILMKFDPELPTGVAYKATVHMYLADAEYLPSEYVIQAYPVSGSWEEGFGKFSDEHLVQSGVTWKSKGPSSGDWSTLGGDYISTSSVSQSFTKHDSKDIDIDITNIASQCTDGIIFKLQSESVAESLNTRLAYFSEDTHTIYRPYLEIKYNDAVYSSSLSTVDVNEAYIHISNLREKYRFEDNVEFRVGARPLYPAREYTTSSLYRDSYILPVSSSWGIKNEYTNEMVVDFSEYTRISADASGSYFNIDMSILEPERYYRLLIQAEESGSIRTIDNRSIFKVVRNGRHQV